MSTLFVTATGTEIGKTLVTAALCHQLRGAGRPVRALKPVLSGYDPATLAESDPGVLLASLGEAVTEDAVARITPWRFAAPLSPRHGRGPRRPQPRSGGHRRLLPRRRGRPAAGRGHRRRHGAAQRRLHRARLDRGIGCGLRWWWRAATSAPSATRSPRSPPFAPAASPSPGWASANRRKARCPWPRRRRPSTGMGGHSPSFWCRASPPGPPPGARHPRSPARWGLLGA